MDSGTLVLIQVAVAVPEHLDMSPPGQEQLVLD